MADKKISALPAATTPLAGTEVLPIVQGGVTDQVSVANLTVGRDVSVKKLNPTDNVVMAAGKGIDFSANANAPGMTSELLTWYEEGAWTPTLAFGGASTGITYALQVGRYTRVGRTVSVQAYLQLSAAGSAAGAMTVEGLPFASANVSNYVCIGVCALDNAATSQDQPIARLDSNSTAIRVMGGTATNNWFQWTDAGILSASLRVFVSLTYTV